jgi:Cof subfamily protein (haloacid dehalogenase superfamily)
MVLNNLDIKKADTKTDIKKADIKKLDIKKPDIKLVAIDLDDTMLCSDCRISERNRRALQKAQEQGVTITIATGRMFVSAQPFALELGISVPLITYQGAMIVMADGRVISHHPMDHKISCSLLRFLRPFGYHINLYMGDDLYIEKDSPEARRYQSYTRTYLNIVPDLQEFLDSSGQGATKFSLIAKPEEVQEVAARVQEEFGDQVQTVASKPFFLEFGRPDMGKGVALSEMAKKLGISREQVMAIGDSPNDLDMIEYAGWGIAMGNADECIKEKARWITATNNEDGVAVALETWVLK